MLITSPASAPADGRRRTAVDTAPGAIHDLVFRAHCLNRHGANLSIMKYYDFQGFLVTGQHSGTHWIKWMLSHALAHRYGVEPPRYFNNSSSNELIGHPKHPRIYPQLPRIASTHTIPPYALDWKWLRAIHRPPPFAVVVRDMRDAMVSNYEKWRAEYAVPFSRYVEGDPRGKAYVCDAWWYVRFLNRWGEIAQRYPEETLVLRYEDFRNKPLENLRRMALHFNLDLSDADLRAGLAVGSKEHMMSRQDPGVAEQPVRPDGAEGARFSIEDMKVLGCILDRHLRHDFGYGYLDAPRGYQIPGPAQSAWTERRKRAA